MISASIRAARSSPEEGPGVEGETFRRTPVQVAVHGDQPGAVLEVAERGVERRVVERVARASQDDHVRGGALPHVDEGHARQVLAHVAAVDQCAPGTRAAGTQVRGGDGGRGEDVLLADGEARCGQLRGDPGAGA